MAKGATIKLSYQRPVVVKQVKLFHYSEQFVQNGKLVVCKQCTSCHGCR